MQIFLLSFTFCPKKWRQIDIFSWVWVFSWVSIFLSFGALEFFRVRTKKACQRHLTDVCFLLFEFKQFSQKNVIVTSWEWDVNARFPGRLWLMVIKDIEIEYGRRRWEQKMKKGIKLWHHQLSHRAGTPDDNTRKSNFQSHIFFFISHSSTQSFFGKKQGKFLSFLFSCSGL